MLTAAVATQEPDLGREGIKVGPDRVPAAELGGLEPADDVLQGCCHHEVLLLQTQLLTFEELQHKGFCHYRLTVIPSLQSLLANCSNRLTWYSCFRIYNLYQILSRKKFTYSYII